MAEIHTVSDLAATTNKTAVEPILRGFSQEARVILN